LHEIKIDLELARQRANRGKHLQGARLRQAWSCLGLVGRRLSGLNLANHRAGVLSGALRKFGQRGADLDQIAFRTE